MIASEAHFMGEPCWHVVEYYERERLARIDRAHARATHSKRVRQIREGKYINPVHEALKRAREQYFKAHV